MSVSVNYRAEEFQTGAGYGIKVAILDATEIEKELFVYRVGGAFSRVATLLDLANYPDGEAAARALRQDYFRGSELVYMTTTPDGARTALTEIVKRIRVVVAARKASIPPNFGTVVEETIS